MMITRQLESVINGYLADDKVIIIVGPRQVGKTTLLHKIAETTAEKLLFWNGDETDIRLELEHPTSTLLKSKIGAHKFLIIDEAQRIKNIGLCLKLIKDNLGVKVIASGSSAFELSNAINEPLTGRKWEFFMYPFSTYELINHTNQREERRLLNHRLVYGYYPDVVNNPGKEEEILKQLADSYLYKDILIWSSIQKIDNLERLLRALAFQIGQQVSINELAQTSSLDFHTTERYIDLLEKAFVIFRISAFSKNLRNEIKKSRKFYFYDNGIRNAIINQFNPLELRNDVGQLWENYMVSERRKYLEYHRINSNQYFWRTHAQQEIDYLEEHNGEISAYEFKFNSKAKFKFPKSFLETYKPQNKSIVHSENYLSFIL